MQYKSCTAQFLPGLKQALTKGLNGSRVKNSVKRLTEDQEKDKSTSGNILMLDDQH